MHTDVKKIIKWLEDYNYVLDKNVLHRTPYDNKHDVCFMFFHGNAEDACSVNVYSSMNCYKTAAFEYPGYGVRQDEVISQKKLEKSVGELVEWLDINVPAQKRIVVCGRSLGTFVAIRLAQALQKRCAGLVLISPMISAVATQVAPPLHKFFYYSDMINNEQFIQSDYDNRECKILIMHGSDDHIVPVTHAPYLADLFETKKSQSVVVRVVEKAGHNDILSVYTLSAIEDFVSTCV